MNWVDQFCCAPPESLAHWGVTGDNHDLLHPGAGTVEEHRRLMTVLRAQRLLKAGGQMTAEDFRDAIVSAMRMLEGQE